MPTRTRRCTSWRARSSCTSTGRTMPSVPAESQSPHGASPARSWSPRRAARVLCLQVPGSAEAFYRGASEPAGADTDPAGPVGFARVRESAECSGGMQVLGPPPFEAAGDARDAPAVAGGERGVEHCDRTGAFRRCNRGTGTADHSFGRRASVSASRRQTPRSGRAAVKGVAAPEHGLGLGAAHAWTPRRPDGRQGVPLSTDRWLTRWCRTRPCGWSGCRCWPGRGTA